jgi:hypothetical protein
VLFNKVDAPPATQPQTAPGFPRGHVTDGQEHGICAARLLAAA